MSDYLDALNQFEWGHHNNFFESFFRTTDVLHARNEGLDEWVDEHVKFIKAQEQALTLHKRALVLACERIETECPKSDYDVCPFEEEKIFDEDGVCEHANKNTEWKCYIAHYLTLAAADKGGGGE